MRPVGGEMSLINEMLRNLEAKRPDDLLRQNLQREIRSLPPATPPRQRWFLLIFLAGLSLLSLGAYWLWANGQALPWLERQIAPLPVVVAPANAPAPLASPSIAVVDIEPPLISDNLRLAQKLAVLPTPLAPVLPVHEPVANMVAEFAKVEPGVTKPVASSPVKIEKSLLLATPRDRADAEYGKAENAMAAGRSAEAMESLRSALKHEPGYVQVRQSMLRQLLVQRKFDEAMMVLQEGLEVQPNQTGWAMSLARLQLEKGDVAAADRTLMQSAGYAEANADYAGFQGHLKTRLGVHRQAVMYYQRATRLSPAEGRWWLGLGLALEADGSGAEAKQAFQRSLATSSLSGELARLAEQHLH